MKVAFDLTRFGGVRALVPVVLGPEQPSEANHGVSDPSGPSGPRTTVTVNSRNEEKRKKCVEETIGGARTTRTTETDLAPPTGRSKPSKRTSAVASYLLGGLPPPTDPSHGVPESWGREAWIGVLRDRLTRTDMPEHKADIFDALANVLPARADQYREHATRLRAGAIDDR